MILLCRVTTVCNLACGFCAYDRRLPFARTTLADARIDRLLELLVHWQQLHPAAGPPLLSWLGGEPLLWSGWVRHSQRARALGLRVSATSNGSTLSRAAVRAAVVEHLDELTVSVDAPGTLHDELRGWAGGYSRILAALHALADASARAGAGLRLRANVVLMQRAIDQFPQLARALAEAGVAEISCNLLGGRDRPDFHARERVAVERLLGFVAALPAVRAQLASLGVQLMGDSAYWQRLLDMAAGVPRPVEFCAPGEQFLFCDERGLLAPCAFTGHEYGVAIEHIDTLDELPARFAASRLSHCASACADCPSTQVFGKFAADVDWAHQAAIAAAESEPA